MRPILYVGTDRASIAQHLPKAMLSFNILEHRKGDFGVCDWIMDSGAFTRITSGRDHVAVADYAQQIQRWSQCGNLEAAVAQDYMCEPFVLAKTGLTTREHQRLTTARWLKLREQVDATYIMPVLQGYTPAEYVKHLDDMSPNLPDGSWVGVGSVCKRNANPDGISAILAALLAVRPDLRLHGFGVKATALQRADIMARFYSVDSMAWSYAARREGRDRHSALEALAWMERVNAIQAKDSQIALL